MDCFAALAMTDLDFGGTPLRVWHASYHRRFPAKPTSPMRTSPKQANILFIMTHPMAAPLLPLHDPTSKIQIPHLSRLAREGVVFDSAYCNSPLCAPSRFSLVTGQLPSQIGGYDNAADLAAEIPT